MSPIDPRIPLGADIGPAVDPYKAFDFALRMRQAKRLEEQDAAEAGYRTQLLQSKQQELAQQAQEREAKQQATQEFNTTMQRVFESGEPSSEAVQRELIKSGHADLFMQIEPHLRGFDEARKKIQEAKLDATRNIAATIHKFGNTPQALDEARPFLKEVGWTDEELAPYYQRAQENPESIAFMTSRFAGDKIKDEKQTERNPTEASLAFQAEGTGPEAEQAGRAFERLNKQKIEKEAKPGSSEDYLISYAKDLGKSVDQLTTKDKEAALRRFNALNDQPKGAPGRGPLKKVTYRDPDTGENVTEYLDDAEIRERQKGGQKFTAPTGATVQSRLVSAKAMYQTGEDIVKQASDPKVKALLGPAMGRFNTLREFVGNPPPELSELAGQIESYGQLALGVHGMRSGALVHRITDMLDQKHTPESIVSTIKGLSAASRHLLENEGMGSAVQGSASAPAAGGGGTQTQGESAYERFKKAREKK